MKELEARYRAAAKARYHEEGSVEVDNDAVVSISDDEDAEGCYIQAWVYIRADELEEGSDGLLSSKGS